MLNEDKFLVFIEVFKFYGFFFKLFVIWFKVNIDNI